MNELDQAEFKELPCTECLTLTRVELFANASDLAPFAGNVCPTCEEKLIADTHDDESCHCPACVKTRPAFTPAGAGGFAPGVLQLVFSRGADDVEF